MEYCFILFIFFLILICFGLSSGTKSPFKSKIEEVFGFDLRSLALFRIVFSILVLGDLILRASDLKAHYTDEGVYPRTLGVQYNAKWFFSFHFMNGTPEWQTILFLIHGLILMCMLIGYKTRLTTFLSWFFLISLQNYNLAVNDAADWFLKLIYFWCMFLPWGARYSIDSALNTLDKNSINRILSFGTFGYIAQVCFAYWFSVPQKLKNIEWRDGSAVFYALNLLPDVSALGQQMAQFPYELLKFLSLSVVQFEIFGPILLLCPIFFLPVRIITIIGFVVLHTGFGTCLNIDFFPKIGTAAMIPFIPGQVWDFLSSKFKNLGLTIYYDGQCGFCKKMVLIIKTFLLSAETKILRADIEPPINEIMQQNNSWVVVDKSGNNYIKFKAFLAVCRASPILYPLSFFYELPLIQYIGNKIYEIIASNRTVGGKLTSLLTYKSLNPFPTKIENILAAFCVSYIFAWNMWMVEQKFVIPEKLVWIGQLLRLDQQWTMYVSRTGWHSGWPVYPGKLQNGQEIDVSYNTPWINWGKPKVASTLYKNRHWKRYIINTTTEEGFRGNYHNYGAYICKAWNSQNPESRWLKEFDIYFVLWKPQEDRTFREDSRLFRWKEYCLEPKETTYEIIQNLEKQFESNKETLLQNLYWAANYFASKYKYEQAEKLYVRALEVHKELVGEKNPQLLEGLKILSRIYNVLGRYDELEKINQQIKLITS